MLITMTFIGPRSTAGGIASAFFGSADDAAGGATTGAAVVGAGGVVADAAGAGAGGGDDVPHPSASVETVRRSVAFVRMRAPYHGDVGLAHFEAS